MAVCLARLGPKTVVYLPGPGRVLAEVLPGIQARDIAGFWQEFWKEFWKEFWQEL